MGLTLSIVPEELEVEPGETAECELQLHNTGSVVDQFTLDIIGSISEWATLEPPVVNLFPDAESTARLILSPPRTADLLAGDIPFAVRATSREDPDGSAIEEGTLTLAPFSEIGGEFVPQGSRGSFRAKHRLAVDNLGNVPITVGIGITAPDNEIIFKIRRSSLTIKPGTAVLIPVRVIPKKRYFKGPNKTHPFQAAITGEGVDPVTADAAMVQEQVFPTWLPAVLAGLVALLITMAILWFALLKPVLKSEAQTAANQQTQQLTSGLQEAQAQAQNANQQAQAANQQASKALEVVGGPSAEASARASATPTTGTGQNGTGGTGGGTGTNGAATTPTPAATQAAAAPTAAAAAPQATAPAASSPTTPPGTTIDLTIQANAPAGQAGTFKTFAYTVPAGKKLLVSDFVISNPAGDSGLLQIRRGASTLIPLGLDNFRSYDQHFIQPIEITAGQQLVLAVDCRNATGACTPSGYFSGKLQ